MALTVAEAVQQLENLTSEREIWMDVVEYLSRCLDSEASSGKAVAYIAVREGGTKVPQPMVEKFIDRINEEEIDPLNTAIEELEGLNVHEETNDGKDPSTRKKTKRKTNKQTTSAKSGGARKSIRAVPKPPRTKAQGSG